MLESVLNAVLSERILDIGVIKIITSPANADCNVKSMGISMKSGALAGEGMDCIRHRNC